MAESLTFQPDRALDGDMAKVMTPPRSADPIGSARPVRSASPLPPAPRLLGWDHLEWWVGNARSMTQFLVGGFGLTCRAYAGPETGVAGQVPDLLHPGGTPV